MVLFGIELGASTIRPAGRQLSAHALGAFLKRTVRSNLLITSLLLAAQGCNQAEDHPGSPTQDSGSIVKAAEAYLEGEGIDLSDYELIGARFSEGLQVWTVTYLGLDPQAGKELGLYVSDETSPEIEWIPMR